MKMNQLSVVILSGGRSSRMGEDKALLQINGQSFVETIAEQLTNAGEILLSVRGIHDFPEINYPHIVDDYPGCGPLAGIHSSLKHARNPWVFVIACDMPGIRESTVRKLLKYADEGTDAVVAKEKNGRLHVLAALYHKRILPMVEEALENGNYRVRQLLEQARTFYIDCEEFEDSENVFRNVNTMTDYKELFS